MPTWQDQHFPSVWQREEVTHFFVEGKGELVKPENRLGEEVQGTLRHLPHILTEDNATLPLILRECANGGFLRLKRQEASLLLAR